jgi:hypothetical protein
LVTIRSAEAHGDEDVSEPNPFATIGDLLDQLSIPFAQKYAKGTAAERSDQLGKWTTIVKAIIRLVMDIGPIWFPPATPINAAGYTTAYLITWVKKMASNAGLDDHGSEAVVLATQRAIEEAVDERRGYSGNIWSVEEATKDEIRARMALAKVYEDAGALNLAIDEYRALIERHPDRTEAKAADDAIRRLGGQQPL